MELEDNFVRQFIGELKSYAPVVLPALLLFTFESGVSLKLWHAVRQLPHLEKDTVPDDSESCIGVEHMYQVRAMREAAKKEARRARIHQIYFGLVLVIIFLLDQYSLSALLIPLMKGEEFDGYVGPSSADEESEFDGQSGSGYSVLDQIDRAKLYFAAMLFIFTGCFLTRALFLISGLVDRAVFRDTKGVPFMVLVKGDRFSPRRPNLLSISVIVIVIVISVPIVAGAVWYHNSICIALIFALMAHFMISDFSTNKVVAFKTMVIASVFLVTMPWLLFGQLLSSQDSFPIRLFPPAHSTGDANWNGLILTALVCTGMFNCMAMCYRMDHAFARPDEFLVRSPDITVTIPVSIPHGPAKVKLPGTRISYHSKHRYHWPKPYFRASILSWLFAYALIAMCTALGYIECEAEFAGVYASYVAFPVMSLCILVCAVLRGEVKKVWAYKEDWATDPGCTLRARKVIPEAVKEREEEKELIKAESDCRVSEA